MNDNQVTVEQLITGSFVKYNKLGELISTSYAGSNCTRINLFIDITSAIKQLYSVDAWTYKFEDKNDIAITLLNMCGHYKEFFNRIGVHATIYLIYGLNCPKINSDTFVKDYNGKFMFSILKKPDVTTIINDNLRILEVLVNFIPGIYYYNIGNAEVSSMIERIINYTKARENGIENIVISKDPLALQLVSTLDARVIKPAKNRTLGKDNDQSIIVDNTNLWKSYICDYRKCKMPDTMISNTFFSNVLAMTRLPERNMKSIFSIPKVFHLINTGCMANFLNPNLYYNQSGINSALDVMDVPHNASNLDMRFKAINVQYQSMYILPMECPWVTNLRMVDIEDPNALNDIISKYFEKPIDLDRLR